MARFPSRKRVFHAGARCAGRFREPEPWARLFPDSFRGFIAEPSANQPRPAPNPAAAQSVSDRRRTRGATVCVLLCDRISIQPRAVRRQRRETAMPAARGHFPTCATIDLRSVEGAPRPAVTEGGRRRSLPAPSDLSRSLIFRCHVPPSCLFLTSVFQRAARSPNPCRQVRLLPDVPIFPCGQNQSFRRVS